MDSLRICFIIDARSAIAQGWIKHFLEKEHEIHIISTRPVNIRELPGAASINVVPIGLTRFASKKAGTTVSNSWTQSAVLKLIQTARASVLNPVVFQATEWVSAVDIYRQVPKVRALIEQIQPDFVHAMRIPYEGILASLAVPAHLPLLVSVWGNDFTLFARSIALVSQQTRNVMRRVSALHADCQRDLDIATQWEFDSSNPQLLAPGGGGIQTDIFFPAEPSPRQLAALNIPTDAPVVINPRGIRSYIKTEVFLSAVPLVLREEPETIFICVNMKGNHLVESQVDKLGIRQNVRLMPSVDRPMMAQLFQLADVMVSPSVHDGTPNTLLEGMACGCFPVVADGVDSIHEWITHEENGLFFDIADPQSQADAILRALADERLWASARKRNQQIIGERAEHFAVMQKVESFYHELSIKKAI